MRVGISLIGTPDGFECLNLGALARSLDIGRSIDLDNSVINILTDTDILAVRRESHRSHFLTYVTYYRFAREIKTSRSGTFYGSSIIFEDFYPNDFSFVWSTLENLADVIQAFCIDRSQNRFHRHFSDDLLPHIAGQNLLVPSKYKGKRVPPDTRLTSTRCFLRLDETVPDYRSFLATVIPRDSHRKPDLADYSLVYTSKHDVVIKEVELRRGLDIETLASLTSREFEESDHDSERQSRQRSDRELQANERAEDLLRDDPRRSFRPGRESAKAEAKANRPSRPTEKPKADEVSSRVLPASRSIPHERFIQPGPGPFIREVKRLLGTGQNRLMFGLLIIALAVGFFVVRWWRSSDEIESGNTLYYWGCVKATRGKDPADIRSRCSPEYVVSQVRRALDDCDAFNERLLKEPNVQAYRERMSNLIKASLTGPPSANQQDTPGELSHVVATRFEVPLEFNPERGESCIDHILRNEDFNRKPSIPATPSPTPTTTQRPDPSSGPTRHPSPKPSATVSPSPTVSPKPSPTVSPKPSLTVSPKPSPTVSPTPTTGSSTASPVASPSAKPSVTPPGAVPVLGPTQAPSQSAPSPSPPVQGGASNKSPSQTNNQLPRKRDPRGKRRGR